MRTYFSEAGLGRPAKQCVYGVDIMPRSNSRGSSRSFPNGISRRVIAELPPARPKEEYDAAVEEKLRLTSISSPCQIVQESLQFRGGVITTIRR